jgi:hypothetical protein
MQRIITRQLDILTIAACTDAGCGPAMPAPESIRADVDVLLECGLLALVEQRIGITNEGRLALEENADRLDPTLLGDRASVGADFEQP